MAAALDLGSSAERRASSSLALSTTYPTDYNNWLRLGLMGCGHCFSCLSEQPPYSTIAANFDILFLSNLCVKPAGILDRLAGTR